MGPVYDICIIGAGMIGSAAARHVIEIVATSKVCIIGPGEPQMRSADGKRSIFGAHYDEGRITRQTASDPVWSLLAKRSIDRYRALERQTGIRFFEDVGYLSVAPETKLYSTQTEITVRENNVPAAVGKWSDIKSTYHFEYLCFDKDDKAILEHGQSGYINPRALVAAELLVAQKRGCDVIRDIVNNVTEVVEDGERFMHIQTENGRKVKARRILIAAGAFALFKNLFPPGIKPNLWLAPQTCILAEVEKEDLKRFWRMPSVSYRQPLETDDAAIGCYILPPIKYPDGRYYIKLGHLDQYNPTATTEEDVKRWYCKPAPTAYREGLIDLLRQVLPDFKPVSISTDTCVTTRTPDRRPYIDMVTPRLGVAIGGNGYAAKSCDEIGRLAAEMLVYGKIIDPVLYQEHFKFRAASNI